MKNFKTSFFVMLICISALGVFAQSKNRNYSENKTQNEANITYINKAINNYSKNDTQFCPPNSIWGQGPSGSAFTSSTESGYRIYQKYEGMTDSIYGIHFWALQLNFNGGAWSQCNENPMNFNISFFTDRFDKPHLPQESMNVSLTPYNTGNFLANVYPILEFTAFFDTPIFHQKGWFAIQSADSSCWSVLIETTYADAMGIAYQCDSTDSTLMENPISFCLLGNPGDCAYPLGLQATSIGDVGAVLSWIEAGNANEWEIEYGEQGFIQGEGTVVSNLSDTTYAISGLSPYTSYDFYVKSICSSESSFNSGPRTFTTIGCPIADQCLYKFYMTDNFGDGWSGSMIEIYENDHLLATATINGDVSKTQYVKLCNNAQIKLKWISAADYDSECGLVLSDPLDIPIFSFPIGTPPSDSTIFYTFTTECNPSCPRPKDLKVENPTFSSVELNWTETGSASQWQVEWGYYGFDFGWGMRFYTSSNQHLLTGLTSSTYYQYYVRAVCAENDTSAWSGPYLFSSDCPAFANYPYVEKFNGTVFPPLCWKNIDDDGDSYTWFRDNNYYMAYEGIYYATSASWHSFAVGPLTPDNYLITRKFSVPNANMMLKFWISALGTNSFGVNTGEEHYSVMVSTTDNKIESFTPIYSETLQDDVWKEITLPLADFDGKDIYIAFRHHDCTDEYYLRLDLISVESTLSTEDIQLIPSFNFYPNPTSDYIYISELSNIEIYNQVGQLISSYLNVTKIDLSGLSAGMYIVKAFTDSKFAVKNIQVIK